jgi:uncharacterized protein (TIGR02757 family)
MFTLNQNLKIWADKYETAEFIQNDPVIIPHRYKSQNVPVEFYGESIDPRIAEKVNIEISAFFTAWVAFGNRKSIIAKADFIDRVLFEGNPFKYIVGESWRKYAGSSENFYRFFTYGDFHNLCERFNKILVSWLTLEDAILAIPDKENGLAKLQSLFGDVEGIPNETSESACKRLCLFLRWMCRKDSPVDFGIWTVCEPKNLIIPLDVHVHKLALKLGLTKRKSTDIVTAIEITDRLAQVFPEDPARGDFALFGFEMDPEAVKPKNLQSVADMSIADVLKTQTFFDQTAAEISRIMDERETARKEVEEKGGRLKSHPLDAMKSSGLLETGEFIVTYAKIVDRVLVSLPAAQREVVTIIGNSAFHNTMKILIETEEKRAKDAKKRNSRKRQSKQ